MNLMIWMLANSFKWDLDLNKITIFVERVFSKSIKMNLLFFLFYDWFYVFIENYHFTIIFFKKLTNGGMHIKGFGIGCKLKLRVVDNLFQLIRQDGGALLQSKCFLHINQMRFEIFLILRDEMEEHFECLNMILGAVRNLLRLHLLLFVL